MDKTTVQDIKVQEYIYNHNPDWQDYKIWSTQSK